MNCLVTRPYCRPVTFKRLVNVARQQTACMSRCISASRLTPSYCHINTGLHHARQSRTIHLTPFSLSPEDNSQEFRPSEELAKERYDLRSGEDVDRKRARLLYQSRKRGMLENGVILASFADKFLDKFNPEQLDQYDRLINLPTNDWDIYYWATRTKPTPPEFETPVMQKLREHLKSKVSKETSSHSSIDKLNDGYEDGKRNKISILDNRNPDDVITFGKSYYELDVDVSETSLVDYKDELYDNRVRNLGQNEYIVRMTEWRKRHFERRIRRTLPAPISLRNLSDEKQTEVMTHRTRHRKLIEVDIPKTDLIDSNYDRQIKHHNFLQHLMSSSFTEDVHEYDDEAEAWADMIWHRNYGSADSFIAPSLLKCFSCSATLHCCDHGLPGYLPKELFSKLIGEISKNVNCQRCKFSNTYNVSLDTNVPGGKYMKMIKEFQMTRTSIICLLVDLTDFPSSIWTGIVDLIGHQHDIIVVGNKLDLLPYDGPGMIDRVTKSVRANLSKLRPGTRDLRVRDVILLSAKTGFAVESLVSRIIATSEIPKDVYLLGCSNSGKSTLFNALLQSDLSELRKGDLLGRVSPFTFPGTNLRILKFPLHLFEGWEIALKKRRMERVERHNRLQEKSFVSSTLRRQSSSPHMSALIDRIDYPSLESNALESYQEKPRFTEDHPLNNFTDRAILSAHQTEFSESAFLHQTPSAYHTDQIHELLTSEERLEVFPNEPLVPRKYSLRPLQTIFISGLARLDLLTANNSVLITIFASKYLPIHVIPTRKADKFYNTFLGSPYLGVPFGTEERLNKWPGLSKSESDFHFKGISRGIIAMDLVLSSIGWAMVQLGPDYECIFRAYTPERRGIYRRSPPFYYRGVITGKKIRDTPLFEHPQFEFERVSA